MRLQLAAVALGASLLLLGSAAFGADQSPAPSPAPAGDAKHGKALYAQHCVACHGEHAEGGFGPALTGETKRKTAAQIRAQIMDPAPPMAKLYPSPLSKNDVDDLTAYVVTL